MPPMVIQEAGRVGAAGAATTNAVAPTTRAVQPDAEVLWSPDWLWFAAVTAVHALATGPWIAHFGLWVALVGGASLLYHGWVLARREVWRLALVEERLVIFEPRRPGRPLSAAKLRGPVWMTPRWVVLRTRRRVLVLRAGRIEPALFARLRRALLLAPAAAR